MKTVKAKKKLGQHFLNDLNIAKKITETWLNENNFVYYKYESEL